MFQILSLITTWSVGRFDNGKGQSAESHFTEHFMPMNRGEEKGDPPSHDAISYPRRYPLSSPPQSRGRERSEHCSSATNLSRLQGKTEL